MIVSAKLDTMTALRGAKHIKTAVQYDKNDSGEAEPSDFAVYPQRPTFNQAHKIRKPALGVLPKLTYVPLKCDQYGSHAMFDVDTPAFTPMLDIESDVPAVVRRMREAGISYPVVQQGLPYEKGIRGGEFPLKKEVVPEPAPMMFRRDYRPEHPYAPPHLNYDLGQEELRDMATRRY